MAVGIGAGGTIVLGIWLAFRSAATTIWDGWIIAAIVLWVVSARGRTAHRRRVPARARTRRRSSRRPGRPGPSAELLAINRTSRGLMLQSAATVVVLLILLDMIWKPGA